MRAKISITMTNLIINGEYQYSYSRYITGDHISLKCENKHNKAHYRSAWELIYYQYLDDDVHVMKYKSEPFKIPYILEDRTRHYLPDILVQYDDHQELVEIKPSSLLSQPRNMAKIEAAQLYCNLNNIIFVVLTEQEFQFK